MHVALGFTLIAVDQRAEILEELCTRAGLSNLTYSSRRISPLTGWQIAESSFAFGWLQGAVASKDS
jgi:hypothetical protein